MSQVRVLINALSAKGGGGQVYLENLFKHFDGDSNLKIWIICPDTLAIPEKPNMERIQVRWPTNNPFLRLPWEVYCLPRLLKRLKIDVLFCPGGFVYTDVAKTCQVAVTFQNLMAFNKQERKRYTKLKYRLKYWLFEKLFKKSLRRAQNIIFISEYSKNVIKQHVVLEAKNCAVIPHGLSASFREQLDRKKEKPSWLLQNDYLLYVSEFRGFYKNHKELVQGYALLKKEKGIKEKLVFLGAHENLYGQCIKEEIKKLGLVDDVLMYDKISWHEIPAVYHNAKVNIFASSCETCSNIVLEALGAGKPLLLSNVPPMPEFGKDAAVYFDPFSPEDFADKLYSILKEEDCQRGLSEKSLALSQTYQWKKTAEETWKFLKNSAIS